MNKIFSDGVEVSLEQVQIHVGHGWHNIVQNLIEDLFVLGWDGNLFQIKEKFGSLRFYTNTANEKINDRIEQAYKESDHTCEACGNFGMLRGGGWLKVLCDEHAKGRPVANV